MLSSAISNAFGSLSSGIRVNFAALVYDFGFFFFLTLNVGGTANAEVSEIVAAAKAITSICLIRNAEDAAAFGLLSD